MVIDKVQGVMLAGGFSERLQFKGLLPGREDAYIFQNALTRLLRTCGDVLVVGTPSGILKKFLPPINAVHLLSDNHQGVLGALSFAAQNTNRSRLLFVHWDNIYPEQDWNTFLSQHRKAVAVRPVSPARRKDLDGFLLPHGWVHRSHLDWMSRGEFALSTPWVLPRSLAESAHTSNSLTTFLNDNNVPSVSMQSEGWTDIGTPEAYAAYIQD